MPTHDWRERRVAPEVWLLCERDLGDHAADQVPFRRPAGNGVAEGARAVGASTVGDRSAYQELKDELGLDHFERRSLPGWQRHVVLTELPYACLEIDATERGSGNLRPAGSPDHA